VRYRQFPGGFAQGAVYIGTGDLSNGSFRNQIFYQYGLVSTSISSYNFVFTFDPIANNISQTITNITTGVSFLIKGSSIYPGSGGLVDGSGNITTPVGTIPINTLNAIEINVSNRNGVTGNIVTASNLTLQTSQTTSQQLNGKFYAFPTYSPMIPTQVAPQYKWPNDGSSPANWFQITGTLQIYGTFTGAENGKLNINIFKCS